MKFDPKHLIAIEIVRREANLTRAADVLGTSQPALSRTLSDLEIRIGAPIFDRRSRPWSLTKLGEGLARQGAMVLRAQERAQQEFTSFTAGGKDKLRLAGPPFFTDGAVTNWLSQFRRRHHDVAFELSYGYGEELEDAVTSGRADVAIYPVGIGDLPPDLVFTPLIEATNVIVCRSTHPLLKLAYPRPLALLRYGWVSPPPGSPLAEDMAVILHALDMREAEIVMTGGSLAGVLSFVAQTECLTVLPGETLRTLGPIYGLSAVPIETGTPRRRLGILSRPRVELGFAAREFIRFATEALEDPKTGSA
jgi:DNA-binding transcriptional LysR family regulator